MTVFAQKNPYVNKNQNGSYTIMTILTHWGHGHLLERVSILFNTMMDTYLTKYIFNDSGNMHLLDLVVFPFGSYSAKDPK